MRYAQRMIPAAVIAVAAAATGIACSTTEQDGATQSSLKPNDPPGNNGTVKIEEFPSDTEVPDNDPHVGCKFEIEFRGYDQGNLTATWALVSQPPSGQDIPVADGSVFIGGDPAGGANDLDGTVIVDLTGVDLAALGLKEQPQQGFHLKLTVHAEGSIGADTKHKVFWVQGCFTPPPDAGPPPMDAGPPPMDAGPPPMDAGPPPQDAGPPPQDAGPPPQDASPPQDSGRTW